jgi:hypothetical protein
MKNNIKVQNVFFHPKEIPEGVNRIFPGDGHLLESFTFFSTLWNRKWKILTFHILCRNIQLLWPCERFICDGHREMVGSHNDMLSTTKSIRSRGLFDCSPPTPFRDPKWTHLGTSAAIFIGHQLHLSGRIIDFFSEQNVPVENGFDSPSECCRFKET